MANTLILLYDGNVFPQAVHYACCFNIGAKNLRMSLKHKEFMPSRYDYTKVFIAVQNRADFEQIISNHEQRFPVEFIDAIPDYRNTPVHTMAKKLLADGYTVPFADLYASIERDKQQEAHRLQREAKEAQIKAEEALGIFNDPAPEVKLNDKVMAPPIKRRKRNA